MFKQMTFLTLLTFALLSTAAEHNDVKIAIQSRITHISNEKKAIMLDLNTTITVGKKALKYMQDLLKDEYDLTRSYIVNIINKIFESEEFDYSINKITDFQTMCIVDDLMHFDDIAYSSADYTINQKIDSELAHSTPPLNEIALKLFNIWYVISANLCGTKLLLKKLELREKELLRELANEEQRINECNNFNRLVIIDK
ncbi:MAG TPA: hypothetical protein VLB80_05340 [Candidatus Babeliales bacterium]|nr:hypothetical protein [Candidatus Babeliales bacterium]